MLQRKLVLVTGGARGIGRAICLELAKAGYDIAINYFTSYEAAIELEEQCRRLGVRSLSFKCNVGSVNQVNQMIRHIESVMGSVDIVINNAAIDLPNPFSLKNAEDFSHVLNVNVVGAYNVVKSTYKQMYDKKWGRIINIASTNGINTYYPDCFDYDASKAALISLTHNLAIQCAPYINVNAIAPGFIGTEHELEGYDPTFLKEEQEKILVGRYGDPEEVAHLVKFLVSDEANFINNTVIRVDGGQMGSV